MSSGKTGKKLDHAGKNAREALDILKDLGHVDVGNAYRVLGVLELSRNDLKKAKDNFIKALREFYKSTHGRRTVWCAVAFWNMHITFIEQDEKKDSLPWLKKAAILHAEIEGDKHPYTRQYRDSLEKLMRDETDAGGTDKDFKLSDDEAKAIAAVLDLSLALL
ncbi:unnamed protein product [Effrenium voratum]|uniref:Uncharacterized protein n=1 Tax=Effrenium voratum TaxID=2562239 RepID=A0AA36N9S7_9DINO|nr:unnamed protein product [Effrenium voratum]CAJ1397984.1 unnamed protein product [Effrenium voratum]CAJ1413306.1 unnamed protein product [Effrenium voratum]